MGTYCTIYKAASRPSILIQPCTMESITFVPCSQERSLCNRATCTEACFHNQYVDTVSETSNWPARLGSRLRSPVQFSVCTYLMLAIHNSPCRSPLGTRSPNLLKKTPPLLPQHNTDHKPPINPPTNPIKLPIIISPPYPNDCQKSQTAPTEGYLTLPLTPPLPEVSVSLHVTDLILLWTECYTSKLVEFCNSDPSPKYLPTHPSPVQKKF